MLRHITAISLVLLGICSYGQWVDLNSGIDDDLTGVWFWGEHGVVCGAHGIYYTTTGGSGAASWTRFEIEAWTMQDPQRYANTRFTALAAKVNEPDVAYFCGTDTVTGQAVILWVDISTLACTFRYVGPPGTALNDILWRSNSTRAIAVGDDGLLVRSASQLSPFLAYDAGTTRDLFCVDGFGTDVRVAGEETIVLCEDGSLGFEAVAYEKPGFVAHGIHVGFPERYAAGNKLYALSSGASAIPLTAYEPELLNGRDIVVNDNGCWVATGHGIYKGTAEPTRLELQASTVGLALEDLAFPTDDHGYAAGADGVVLTTTNGGGPTIPYTVIDAVGGCAGQPIALHADDGSANQCRWYVDGVQMSTNCSAGFTFQTDVPGAYEVMFVGTNSAGYTDTSTATMHVTPLPSVDLHVHLDSVLCKREPLTVTIADSEENVRYFIADMLNPLLNGTGYGTGGLLTVMTDSIGSGSYFRIHVRNELSGCGRFFPDTLHIDVEHTQARMHMDRINARPMEPVGLHGHALDAQHYLWNFGPSATPGMASTQDVMDVVHSAPGPTTVELICWSDAGCYDTLSVLGPFIFGLPTDTDSCWAMTIPGDDAGGDRRPKVSDAASVGDGFLVCGAAYAQQLVGRAGSNGPFRPGLGTYLAKYTYSGVLRWAINGYRVYGQDAEMRDVAVSRNGEILLVGSNPGVVDNRGDTVSMPSDGYLIALDADGNYLWKGLFGESTPDHVDTLMHGDLLLAGGLTFGLAAPDNYFRVAGESYLITEYDYADYFLLRTNAEGVPVWSTVITFGDSTAIRGVFSSNDGGFLVAGDLQRAVFYSANTGPTYDMDLADDHGLFLCKYDSLGRLAWHVSQSSGPSGSIHAADVDAEGNWYVVGDNGIASPTGSTTLQHSDGSTASMTGHGPFWVAKFDPSGHLIWSNGAQDLPHSQGKAVLVEGERVIAVGAMNDGTTTGSLTSVGTAGGSILVNNGDCMIAVYDLDGALFHSYVTSGQVPLPLSTGSSQVGDHVHVLTDPFGQILLAGSMTSSEGIPYFGDTLVTIGFQDQDAFLAKTSLTSCSDFPTTVGDDRFLEPSVVMVHPNPFEDRIHVSWPDAERFTLRIVDLMGRELGPLLQVQGPEAWVDMRPYASSSAVALIIEGEGTRSVHVLMPVQ